MLKVWNAIVEHGGQTLLSTGITGDDARLAKAVVDSGVKLLEPNHPAVALARGHKGVTTMHESENIRHGIELKEMAKVVKGVRNTVGNDPFITIGIPGGFPELILVELEDEDFKLMSVNGADGLHAHKSNLENLKELVKKAHKFGLTVDAYIGHPDDLYTFGIPTKTRRLAKAFSVSPAPHLPSSMVAKRDEMNLAHVAAGRKIRSVVGNNTRLYEVSTKYNEHPF